MKDKAIHWISIDGKRYEFLPKKNLILTQPILGELWIPSGNLLHSYWKWPFIVDFPII